MPAIARRPGRKVANDQPKGERTRARILDAAARLFADKGYDGTGIRDVESAAKVKRGVVTYHFGNKEDLWKAMFAFTFKPYLDELESKQDLLRALEPKLRNRFLLENFVRTSAARPLMNRLMIQENFTESWRSRWIVRNFLEPVRELSIRIADGDPVMGLIETDPHIRYAILGACNSVFSHRCEVKALFGEDVGNDTFIDRHVATVIEIVDALLKRRASTEEKKNV